jgi:hypothetical protein
VRAFISKLGISNPRKSSNNPGIDEALVGRTLSPELFHDELSGLGYDFEVFVDGLGKIWRFRRIKPLEDRSDGDVW